jgi:hypothetical protein
MKKTGWLFSPECFRLGLGPRAVSFHPDHPRGQPTFSGGFLA